MGYALRAESDGYVFRPIHYLGNKHRYLAEIQQAVDEVAEPLAPALDLFSGTGVVAAWLGRTRPILANDVQAYSGVLTEALLNPSPALASAAEDVVRRAMEAERSSRDVNVDAVLVLEAQAIQGAQSGDFAPLALLMAHSPIERGVETGDVSPVARVLGRAAGAVPVSRGNVSFRQFGGVFFSYRQARELDALAEVIRASPLNHRNLLLATLLSVASALAATVGSHFAQPTAVRDRRGAIKSHSARTVARKWGRDAWVEFLHWSHEYSSLAPSSHPSSTLTLDYREALEGCQGTARVIYADPPYTRDHYSRFYHVLETLTLGDVPEISVVHSSKSQGLSRGVYRENRHQSPFCIATQVEGAFDALFRIPSQSGIPMVLSYSPLGGGTRARSRTRLLSVGEIVNIAERYYSVHSIEAIEGARHSRLNRKELHGALAPSAEVLLTLVP